MTAKEKLKMLLTDPLRLSLPEGGRFGPTGLNVVGRGYAEISGCVALTDYKETGIAFTVKEGTVRIVGKELTLRSYGFGRVAVSGQLTQILFEEHGEDDHDV